MSPFYSIAIATDLLRIARCERLPTRRLEAWLDRRLRARLRYAVERVPYYRDLAPALGVLDGREALSVFPPMTKEILQNNFSRLVADGFDAGECRSSSTSGSTGEPTTVLFDDRCWRICKYSLKIRRLLRYGIGIGKRILVVSELSPEEIGSAGSLTGQGLLFDERKISIHEPIERLSAEITDFRPHAIYGFPSFFAELLEHMATHGMKLPEVSVVFTSSEVLTAGLRARIAESFDAQVCDVYGSTELKEVAWQCPFGHYHVNLESAWVEIGESEAADGCGDVYLTALTNRAMPLIRYRVGDRARFAAKDCPCGRSGPAIEAIGGREVEMIELPGEKCVSPYLLTTVIERDPAIQRYQIVQRGPRELEVLVRPLPGLSVDSRAMKLGIEQIVGENINVESRIVERIERAASGKQHVFYRDFRS